MALWVFGALQLLAIPATAFGTCTMVCSLDGSGCCCRPGFGDMPSPTGEHRYFGRPWAEELDRSCPAAVFTVVSLFTAEAAGEPITEPAPPTAVTRLASLIDSGESPGDTQGHDPPRPPPSPLVRNV